MTLSYKVDPFGEEATRRKITVRITTEHSASSYGRPVIVFAGRWSAGHDVLGWMWVSSGASNG